MVLRNTAGERKSRIEHSSNPISHRVGTILPFERAADDLVATLIFGCVKVIVRNADQRFRGYVFSRI
jgi:hypothetical protein